MLTFFRTNQVFYSVLLIFYILLLRFSVFLAPFQWEPSGHGVFSELVYGLIGSQTLVAHGTAIVLVLIQAFLVNLIAINGRLANEVNLFPGLFYVWISCCIPDFLYLSPVLMGSTFFLMSVHELFDTYKNPACADRLFNAGLWMGVASLFYFPFAFFLLFLLAGLNILRAFNLQEVLMIGLGMFLPYLLTALYFFWVGAPGRFWDIQFSRNLSFWEFGGGMGWEAAIKLLIFGILIVFVLFNNGFYLIKKNIQVQKKISILYWALVAAVISVPFQTNVNLEHLLMLAPALGILLSFTFTSMKPQWAESIHFLMVVVALAMQFVPWQL